MGRAFIYPLIKKLEKPKILPREWLKVIMEFVNRSAKDIVPITKKPKNKENKNPKPKALVAVCALSKMNENINSVELNSYRYCRNGIIYEEQIYLIKDESTDFATSVWKGYYFESLQLVAIKIYSHPNKEIIQKKIKEVEFLEKLSSNNHPFFLKFYDCYFSESSEQNPHPSLSIVMEYCPSSLHRKIMEKIIWKENEKKLAKIIDKLLAGFVELSNLKIAHRDIKPQNILISENGDYKLSDYGLSIDISSSFEEDEYTVQGTRDYMSPELISFCQNGNSKSKKLKYNLEKSDVFSLGLVFLKIYKGKRIRGINSIKDPYEMLDIINAINIAWLRKLLEKMLCLDPKARFTFKESYDFIKQDKDFINNLHQ